MNHRCAEVSVLSCGASDALNYPQAEYGEVILAFPRRQAAPLTSDSAKQSHTLCDHLDRRRAKEINTKKECQQG